MNPFERGAVRPELLDVLTALILLAILLWASWKQFPAYDRHFRRPMPPARALQRSSNF
jgi:hypothetical protein